MGLNLSIFHLRNKIINVVGRAGLNEREVPGEVVTARPTKRLAQAFHILSFQL